MVRGVFVLILVAGVAAILAVPSTAIAGRSQYGWLFGSEVMPERGAEIQTWVAEENGKPPGHAHDTWLLWGAFVGVTDKLELGFPVELLWRRLDGMPATFRVDQFGIEARYRFVSSDPAEAPAFAPLLRLAVKRDVATRERVRTEADLVASYQAGRLHALIDIGAIGEFSRDDSHLELRPGAGISLAIGRDLRLGVEGYAELSADDERASWAVVGPNLAWSHGRFWLSAAFGIGVYQIDTAPRFVWGIMF